MRLQALLRPLVYLSLAGLAACGRNPPRPSAATPESTPPLIAASTMVAGPLTAAPLRRSSPSRAPP